MVRPADAFGEAKASAERALDLDPNLADAHRTLGFVQMYQWDWPGAEAAFQAALAAAPGATEAHGHYALYLIVRGRCAEAVASAEHARSLDPLSPMIGNDLALALWTAHRHEEALDRYRQTLELEPDFVESRRGLGLLHAFRGDFTAALPELERAVTLARDVEALACLGYALALDGREHEARALLAEVDASESRPHLKTYARCLVHLGLGDHDRALDSLERACDERTWQVVWLGSWPLFDPLRSTPRFRMLLARVGLG